MFLHGFLLIDPLCSLRHFLSKVMINQDLSQRAFCNLKLSYRGSERQAPSSLSLALTFSSIMQAKAAEGSHAGMSTEERLRQVTNEWHNTPGVINRWHLDEGKQKAILNLLIGTSAETRACIQQHLHYFKWKDSALCSDLLRSSRWLIGAVPKAASGASTKKILTVTAGAQEAFIQNYIEGFIRATKKVKPTARGKLRASVAEWDRLMDYACVMYHARTEAEDRWSHDQTKCEAVLESIETAFMSRPAVT